MVVRHIPPVDCLKHFADARAFGLRLSTTWLYGVVHFLFGFLLALMPSTSVPVASGLAVGNSKPKVTVSSGVKEAILKPAEK